LCLSIGWGGGGSILNKISAYKSDKNIVHTM